MEFLSKIFKKQKVEEVYEEEKIDIPDLMEYPVAEKRIDLMSADPIFANFNNEPAVSDKKADIKESMGIEKQLVDNFNGDIINTPVINKQESDVLSHVNAFNMPLPDTNESSLIETLETESVNLQKTQKFCSQCGTPNDILNKFCVSCGNDFK